jgi:hypothetical protein
MPVPSPLFGWANTPSGFPTPLSATERFQSVPEISYETVICPSFPLPLKAYFQGIDDEFRNNQPKTLGVAAVRCPTFTGDLQDNRLIFADHGV